LALLSTDPGYKALSSATEQELKEMCLEFLRKEGPKKGKKVRIVVLADAKIGAESERPGDTMLKGKGRDCIPLVKNCVSEAGMVPSVVAFGFRLKSSPEERRRARQFLKKPGTIVVVLGGNTFHLSAGLSKVPIFRKLLIRRVKEGKVMYVAYSAGSMFAGKSISHSRDRKLKKPKVKGLRLLGRLSVNPHANEPSALGRVGVDIPNGKAMFLRPGKKAKIV